jgi:uncharacterized protein YodC (DUF2158 family)
MVAIGDVVTCRQTGSQLWVVRARAFGADAARWYLRGKGRTRTGRPIFTARVAGDGDLALVTDAPRFSVGDEVRVNGGTYTVAKDLGDTLELVAPEVRYDLGDAMLYVPGGHHMEVSKADIMIDTF